MIIDNKKLFPDDTEPVLLDAPPSYEDVGGALQEFSGDQKQPLALHPSRPGESSSQQQFDAAPPRVLVKPFKPLPTNSSSPFGYSAPSAKSQSELRTTVLALVRDLVQGASRANAPPSAARGILDSCAAACAAHNLNLSAFLQEHSIEGHTPAYWAVLRRGTRPKSHFTRNGSNSSSAVSPAVVKAAEEAEGLLYTLLEYTTPLTPATISDIRLACLVVADNDFLQQLRALPAFAPLSGTDAMLLGSADAPSGSVPESTRYENTRTEEREQVRSGTRKGKERATFSDIVEVQEGSLDTNASAGAFRVMLRIAHFQRRMRVSEEIGLEFIARGRLWSLKFFVVQPSTSSATSQHSSTSRRQRRANAPSSSISDTVYATARSRGLAAGSWAVSLALLPHSPQSFVDARLVIAEPPLSFTPPALPSTHSSAPNNDNSENTLPLIPIESSLSDASSSSLSALPLSPPPTPPKPLLQNRIKSGPAITLRLKNKNSAPLVAPPVPSLSSDSAVSNPRANRRERRSRDSPPGRRSPSPSLVLAGFSENSLAENLVYDGSSYVSADGALHAVLEVRLAKQETDCIIC